MSLPSVPNTSLRVTSPCQYGDTSAQITISYNVAYNTTIDIRAINCAGMIEANFGSD